MPYNIVVSNDTKIRGVMDRPSRREIINKITEAIAAIQEGKKQIPFSKHFTQDQSDLGIEDTADLWPLLLMLLEEIKESGPNDLYAGGRPPEKSYEVGLDGQELWAYSWDSTVMNSKMYLKFIIKKGYYFYMGCHKSKY